MVSGGRYLVRVLLIAAALGLCVGGPGPARGGGTPIGFVSLPARGTLAVIALPNGGILAHIKVTGKPDAVAASMNGRRVLVASPAAGAVTEIDGIHHRILQIFRGIGRPVDVAFDYEPPVGIVTPRYAFVLEQARGTLAVLDLAHGRIASRIAVGVHPKQIAVDGSTLWIAHAESGLLTRVDVAPPTKPRLLAGVDSGGKLAALVADPELQSVFVAFRHSGVVARYADGGARAKAAYRTTIARAPLAGLAVALPQFLIAADRHGVLHLMREQNGRRVSKLRGPLGIRSLDVYGGWLVAILPRTLRLLGVPDGAMRSSVSLGSRLGGFAWAVL